MYVNGSKPEYPSWVYKPQNLRQSEIDDPMLILDGFFSAYTLYDARKCLKNMFVDAIRAPDVLTCEHYMFFDDVTKLIEIADVVHKCCTLDKRV